MIKMCFFDKRNNSMIVNAFKQLLKRRGREKLFTRVPEMGGYQKDVLYSEWKSTNSMRRCVGGHQKAGTSVLCGQLVLSRYDFAETFLHTMFEHLNDCH